MSSPSPIKGLTIAFILAVYAERRNAIVPTDKGRIPERPARMGAQTYGLSTEKKSLKNGEIFGIKLLRKKGVIMNMKHVPFMLLDTKEAETLQN